MIAIMEVAHGNIDSIRLKTFLQIAHMIRTAYRVNIANMILNLVYSADLDASLHQRLSRRGFGSLVS
jgi:hypothetical protein